MGSVKKRLRSLVNLLCFLLDLLNTFEELGAVDHSLEPRFETIKLGDFDEESISRSEEVELFGWSTLVDVQLCFLRTEKVIYVSQS